MSVIDSVQIQNEAILLDLKNKMGFADINIRFFELKPQLAGAGMANYKAVILRRQVEKEIANLEADIKKYKQLLKFAEDVGLLEDK